MDKIPVLQLTDASYTYPSAQKATLVHLTCEIYQGERIAIVGKNASGKSTLAQVLAGILAPDHGLYRALSTPRMIMQQPDNQMLTSCVYDEISFGVKNLGVSQNDCMRIVEQVLHDCALSDVAYENPQNFSGGQKLRVVLAATLAMNPEIIILDEASAMLDVRGKRGLEKELKKLQQQKKTIIQVTHDLQEAQQADRIFVVEKGTIQYVAHKHNESEQAYIEHLFNHNDDGQVDTHLDSCIEKLYADKPNTPTHLSIKQVGFCYNKAHTVLSDVSCELHAGTIHAVIGHTGSGKSTLAQLIAHIHKPTTGSIHHTDNVGYVMQMPERQLFAQTVFDDVAFSLRQQQFDEQIVRQKTLLILQAFDLLAYKDRSPYELSGGKQRLCALAGILAQAPRIIVFDEVEAGLDAQWKTRIHHLIQTLKRQGCICILITHDMQSAYKLADSVCVLDHGSPCLEGSAQDVFAAIHKNELENIGLDLPERARDLDKAVVRESLCKQQAPTQLPHIKSMLFTCLLLAISVFQAHKFFEIVLLFIFLVFLFWHSHVSFRQSLAKTKFLLPFIVVTSVMTSIFNQSGYVVSQLFGISIWSDGITQALSSAFHMLYLSYLGVYLYETFPTTKLIYTLADIFSPLSHLRVPVQEFSLILSLSTRFLDTIAREVKEVSSVQKARGAHIFTSHQSLRKGIRSIPVVLVPVMCNTLRRTQEIAITLMMRNWSKTNVNVHETHTMSVFDMWTLCISCALLIMVVVA